MTGSTIGDNVAKAAILDDRVIKPLDTPVSSEGGIAVLFGNLCPDGALIKQAAASKHLMHHTGRAVVFETKRDLMVRINQPELVVDEVVGSRSEERWPERGPGDAGVGNAPDPREATTSRSQGYGSCLGTPA